MTFDFESNFNRKYSTITRRIIRILCEDSRVPLSGISDAVHISRRNLAKRLVSIRREFGLVHTLELNQSGIGLNAPHIIVIKFGERPNIKEVKERLEQSYLPQLAFTTKGNYDMVIYANARSRLDYLTWDREMRRQLASKYDIEWHASEVGFKRIGFFPIRNKAIDVARVSERHKTFLKILNDNSRISFKELARQLSMNYKTTIYNFRELLKRNYIRGFTTIMNPPDDISLLSVFIRYALSDDTARLARLTEEMFTGDDKNSLLSRYLLKVSLVGSYDSFTIGAFDNMNRARKYCIKLYRDTFGRFAPVKLAYGEIEQVILGRLPIRSIDTAKSYKHSPRLIQ